MPDLRRPAARYGAAAGWCVLPLAVACLCLASREAATAQTYAPGTAQAYAPDDVLTIRQRIPQDNAPLGVRVGSFIIDPGIELETIYDDNLFRTEHNKTSDFVTDVKPGLALQSDWNRHALFFGAEGDFGRFANDRNLNYADYGLLASGQYDIAYQTYLTAALTRAHRHEDLGTLDDPNGNQPVSYTSTGEQLGFTRALGRLSLRILGENDHVSLAAENGSSEGGFLDQQEGLSRDDRHVTTRIAFETMPGDDIFTQLLYDDTNYEPLNGGGKLTSRGGDARAGIDFTAAGNLSGSLFGGYLYRSYDDQTNATRDPYGGGRLTWALSPLTSIDFLTDKTFNETTVAGGAGVVQTRHRLTAQHSFTTKFSGSLTLGLDNERRTGNQALNDTARFYYGGAAGTYQVTDTLGLRFNYVRSRLNSNIVNNSYRDNRVILSLIYMR